MENKEVMANRAVRSANRLPFKLLLGWIAASCATISVQVSAVGLQFDARVIAEDFAYPWSLSFISTRELLIAERPGRLWRIDLRDRTRQQVVGLPSVANLYDVLAITQDVDRPTIYLAYIASAPAGGGGVRLRVLRASLLKDSLVSQQVVFVSNSIFPEIALSGGRLAAVPGLGILLSVGDRPEPLSQAQATHSQAGSLLRLFEERNSAASSNGPSTTQERLLREKYASGLRNVQGLAVDSLTGRIFMTDHGPQGGDELNVLVQDGNYGWPLRSFGRHYGGESIPKHQPADGFVYPIHYWETTVAPSGLAVYRSHKYPELSGDLLVGSLVRENIIRIKLRDEHVVVDEPLLIRSPGRIRDVRVGPDGSIYALTDSATGKLLSIEPVTR
jgi:glucose/arabinose dehydrogenase